MRSYEWLRVNCHTDLARNSIKNRFLLITPFSFGSTDRTRPVFRVQVTVLRIRRPVNSTAALGRRRIKRPHTNP